MSDKLFQGVGKIEFNEIEFRSLLGVKLINETRKEDNSLHQEFLISQERPDLKRSCIIHIIHDDSGVRIEPQDTTFFDKEIEIIKERLVPQYKKIDTDASNITDTSSTTDGIIPTDTNTTSTITTSTITTEGIIPTDTNIDTSNI
jgi:hypothetical protein